MYVFLTGYPAFGGSTPEKIFQRVLKAEPNYQRLEKHSKAAQDLVKMILIKVPDKRATIDQILDHEWFKMELIETTNPLDKETIKRMYSYLSRAEEYYDEGDSKACGTISYLLWGGKAGLRWSESKLKELDGKKNS